MNATDPRVESAHALLTGPRLLAGQGDGFIRFHDLARILQVPLADRLLLLAFIENRGLWLEPPTSGPLSDRPLAGCMDLNVLREALQQGLAAPGGLPFAHNLVAQS